MPSVVAIKQDRMMVARIASKGAFKIDIVREEQTYRIGREKVKRIGDCWRDTVTIVRIQSVEVLRCRLNQIPIPVVDRSVSICKIPLPIRTCIRWEEINCRAVGIVPPKATIK